MKKKEVWTLVEQPSSKNVIRGLWFFKVKHNTDRTVSKNQARFVAMGNTQTPGENLDETFCTTGKPTLFRLLVAIAEIHDWEIHQMDEIAAFLNGVLTEDLYPEQPQRFAEAGKEHLVCKLVSHRAIPRGQYPNKHYRYDQITTRIYMLITI